MNRPDEFRLILQGDPAKILSGTHPQDAWLYKVLAHVAFSDREYVQEEFDALERLMPGLDVGEIMDFMIVEADRTFDFGALSEAFPVADDRQGLLALAKAMVEVDRVVKDSERQFVGALERALRTT